MKDPAALLSSIGNFATKAKAAIDAGDAQNTADLVKVVDDLTQQVNEEIGKFGMDNGGEQVVAITEKYIALGGGSQIDCSAANHFSKTITAATTFTVTKVPSAGRVYTMSLSLINGGAFPVKFWNNVRWSDGTKPEFSANGRDVVAFSTEDGGATWDGYLLGKGMRVPA